MGVSITRREVTDDEKKVWNAQLDFMRTELTRRLPASREKDALLTNLQQAQWWLEPAPTSMISWD